MKKIFFTIILISSFCYSQVGIGTTTPNGALDINSSTNGIVVPNVALTSRATSAPVVNPNGGGAPLTGTLVWNTSTAGSSPNNVVPGFYFWDGAVWIAIAGDGGKNWTTSGNGGTTAGTNFIGTNEAIDFRIKTNATDRWNISNTNAGQLQSYSLGTASLPIYSFQSNTNTGLFSSSANNLDFSTNGTARFRIPNANQIHALSLGTAALPFYSFSADTGIGMWSPTTSTLAFSTAGAERMRMLSDGRTVINSTSPYASDRFSTYGAAGEDAVNGYATTTGTGVYGSNSGTGSGVYGTTTGATGAGVFGVADVTNGAGVYGSSIGTTATGVYGFASGSGGAGVYGSTNGVGGSTGVTGVTTGTSSNSYAVSGLNNASTGGTAFTPTTACRAAVIGNASLTGSYKFGVYGYGGFSTRTGGVFGNNLGFSFGSLGYYSSGSTNYSFYGFGTAVATGALAGRIASNQLEKNTHIGLGIYGGVMGGWVRGLKYGFHTKGDTYSLYIDGNGYTNKPFTLLTETDNEKVATFMTTSTKPEVTCNGKSKLIDGKVFIAFNTEFNKVIANVDDIIINVTPQGNSKGVFVTDISKEGFWIYENDNGNSNIKIFWSANATIKNESNHNVPADLLATDFDSKMDGVMFNDNNKEDTAQSLWWDGSKIRWDKPEARAENNENSTVRILQEKKKIVKPKK